VGVGEGVSVGEGVGLGVAVGDGDGVGEGVGLGVGDGVGLGVGEGVGVGVGTGATTIDPETPAIVEFDVSAAATVWVPTVFNVTAKKPAPFVSGPLAGRIAARSLLVSWTVPE
jgi:hypothetical protein